MRCRKFVLNSLFPHRLKNIFFFYQGDLLWYSLLVLILKRIR
jgi:hypothetical protein